MSGENTLQKSHEQNGKILPMEDLQMGLNKRTADWLNSQQQRMEKGTKLLMEIALSMGEILADVQNSHSGKFADWLSRDVNIPSATAYRYISLYNYKNEISGAETLNKAYEMIETFEKQKKQSETAKAYQRVNDYKKTGVKPEGWRRGTDDKLAKEETDRDARIEAVKQEALDREKAKQEQAQERIKSEQDRKQENERRKAETDELIKHLDQRTKTEKKRQEFKEKIRLSAGGMTDPFQDALIDYLDGLDDGNRQIEACYNIIKICKRIAAELQAVKK